MKTKRVYKFRPDNSLAGFFWLVPKAWCYVMQAAMFKHYEINISR